MSDLTPAVPIQLRSCPNVRPDPSCAVIESVNGQRVRSLKHMVELLRDLKDEQVVLRFDQRYGETIILPRQATLAATEEILSDNGIRTQGSEDMMKVWQRK